MSISPEFKDDKSQDLNEILDLVGAYTLGSEVESLELIKKAYYFAREAHCSQIRKEGSPYITHVISVAKTLAEMRMDPTTIIVGLLHDTIEDTGITSEDITGIFGKEVARLVESLTKISKLHFNNHAQLQAENFRKMYLATANDVRVILVKFADRLHNMKTLQFLDENKRKRIALETLELYAPLANLLGIGWIKNELEDLSFKYLHPLEYNEIANKVSKKKEEYESYLKDVEKVMEAKLNDANIPATISGRVKHYYSIYKKMTRQDIPFEQVHDVLGLRIITDSNEHCYTILGFIHSKWIPVPGRFKDYIGAPKQNLYQSLHTTAIGPKGEKIEFQIRTAEMEHIAEEGIASHWRYKSGLPTVVDDKRVKRLRDNVKSYEWSDAQSFLANVKSDVFPYHVYVFSPKGDVFELSEGSTIIDFAYHIHTKVGHHCKYGIVDGMIVPLKYVIENGNTIEVVTSPSVEPTRDWLKIAKTQRARNRIKQYIKQVERKNSMELGVELLENELKKQGLSAELGHSEDVLQGAKKFASLNNLEDLYVLIGYGKLSTKKIVEELIPPEPQKPEEQNITEKTIGRLFQLVTKDLRKTKEKQVIEIRGLNSNIMFHRSKCCYPIPGEEIVGFVTKGRGISIHRMSCQNLEVMTVDKDRLVEVQWLNGNDVAYPVKIKVKTKDQVGILAKVTSKISDEKINITDINAKQIQKGYAHFEFLIEVEDTKKLDKVTKGLFGIKGVMKVERMSIS
jgi:GTP pyrophosphokinase